MVEHGRCPQAWRHFLSAACVRSHKIESSLSGLGGGGAGARAVNDYRKGSSWVVSRWKQKKQKKKKRFKKCVNLLLLFLLREVTKAQRRMTTNASVPGSLMGRSCL